jgi:hypothetical protein
MTRIGHLATANEPTGAPQWDVWPLAFCLANSVWHASLLSE